MHKCRMICRKQTWRFTVFIVGSSLCLAVGCGGTDQRVESSAQPDDTKGAAETVQQIDPPAVVAGAGLVSAAPATVPTSGTGERGGTEQSKRLLFVDLAAGSSIRLEVETAARYITPVAGAVDRDRIGVLLRTCSDGVYSSFVQCGDETFGVMIGDRVADGGAAVLPLPVETSTDTFRGLAMSDNRLTTLRVSTAKGMGDGTFDPTRPATARIDVLVSSDGGPFRSVASQEANGLEPCVTADGAAWNIDAGTGTVSRFDPAQEVWAPVPGLTAKPLSTLSCGSDKVALVDSQARSVLVLGTASPNTAVPLTAPDTFWGAGAFADATRSVRFDPVTSRPYATVPIDATAETQLVDWNADGSVRATRVLPPGFQSWLPLADGEFWRTTCDREAEVVKVEAK